MGGQRFLSVFSVPPCELVSAAAYERRGLRTFQSWLVPSREIDCETISNRYSRLPHHRPLKIGRLGFYAEIGCGEFGDAGKFVRGEGGGF